MNREDIDQAAAELEAEERLAAAKTAIHDDVCSECGRIKEVAPDDERYVELDAAKQELIALRQGRRKNGAPPASPEDGVATPEAVVTGAVTTEEN